MSFFLFIISRLVTSAHATNLDTWGSQGSGVSEMWQRVRNTLYTRQDPIAGLSDAAISFLFPMIGGVAALLVLYAGIKMITGQGQEDSFAKAKEIIYYALAGVLLASLAAAIIGYFGTVFFPTLFQ